MLSSSPPPGGQPILSRVFGGAFINRKPQLDKLMRAAGGAAPRAVLILGQPQVGKTELLRTAFDLLFTASGPALPIYYYPRPEQMSAEKLARDFLFTLLRQYLAFTNQTPQLLTAPDLTARDLRHAAGPGEYDEISELLEGYEARASAGNEQRLLHYAFGAPLRLAARTPHRLVLMIDEAQMLNQVVAGDHPMPLLNQMLQEPPAVSLVITGLQRTLLEHLSVSKEVIGDLWLDWLEPLDLPMLQSLVEQWCARLGVALDAEIGRLAIQQLGGNLLYLRSLVTAAGERKINLDNPVEFERLYVDELLRGRIAQHFSSLLRRIGRVTAVNPRGERAATGIVDLCHEAIALRSPVELIEFRLNRDFHAQRLLSELHQHELITILDDHVLPSDDPVFCDWLRATHQRFSGTPASEVTLDLLSRRVKAVPQMLASSELRTLHTRITELLNRFDRQSVARSLFVQDEFLIRYGSAKYDQIISGLRAESERVTLPQVIYVTETPLSSADGAHYHQQSLPPWSCIIAYGFDEACYDNEHEAVWVIAVNTSPAAITEETIAELDGHLATFRDPLSSGRTGTKIVRWAISKMGFTREAVSALRERGFLTSDYLQVELLADTLPTSPKSERAIPISVEIQKPDAQRDFDLAIPIGEDREIIAARVAEQIARTAGFPPEELNQLKTALIEACLSLSAIGISPDGRIYQRFHADQEKMTITVASSAAALDQPGGVELKDDPRGVWRLQVLTSLVDQVTLTQLVGGFRVVLTKRRSGVQ